MPNVKAWDGADVETGRMSGCSRRRGWRAKGLYYKSFIWISLKSCQKAKKYSRYCPTRLSPWQDMSWRESWRVLQDIQAVPRQAAKGASDQKIGRSQERILEILGKTPGASIQTLADALSITHASATYALNQLRRKSLISQKKDGQRKLNFLVVDVKHFDLITLQPTPADSRKNQILELLAAEPNRQRTINWLAERIGASHAFVSRCLPGFIHQNLIILDRTPDRYYVRAGEKLAAGLPGGQPLRDLPAEPVPIASQKLP